MSSQMADSQLPSALRHFAYVPDASNDPFSSICPVHLLETFVCVTDRLVHSVRERQLCTYLYVHTWCCIGQRIERDRPSWRRALNHWALDIWTKDRVHRAIAGKTVHIQTTSVYHPIEHRHYSSTIQPSNKLAICARLPDTDSLSTCSYITSPHCCPS